MCACRSLSYYMSRSCSFQFCGAACPNSCSSFRSSGCDWRTAYHCTRNTGTSWSGYAGCCPRCSSCRSYNCALHSHSLLRRNIGSNSRAGAGWTNTVPKSRNCNCDRLRRLFHAWTVRNHSYTPDNRCACRLPHFRNPAPTNGCRRTGKSMNHKNQNRDFYTHNCLNIAYNGTNSTHNIRHDLWKCATVRRKFPAKTASRRRGKRPQQRYMFPVRTRP